MATIIATAGDMMFIFYLSSVFSLLEFFIYFTVIKSKFSSLKITQQIKSAFKYKFVTA